MISPLLQRSLEPVALRFRRLRFWRRLALAWGVVALAGILFLLAHRAGQASLPPWALLLFAIAAAVGAWFAGRSTPDDFAWIAAQIEKKHPELNSLLLAAIEQRAQAGGEFGFLQQRIIREALEHDRAHDWEGIVPAGTLQALRAAAFCSLAVILFACLFLRQPSRVRPSTASIFSPSKTEIAVTPGDASVEKGSSLVVLARFSGPLPPGADLVINGTTDNKTVPLTKSLDDPIFGGTVPEVTADFLYHVEYHGEKTRDYKIKVFEHPRLERSDISVKYPDYTSLPEKTIRDTRRVSAVEGSALQVSLQLNKPVVAARLIAADKTIVPLTVASNQANAVLSNFQLVASKAYELQLVDADGRTNKVTTQFVFDALKNRPPELKLASPRGDVRASPLEEIVFEGEAWDDFGLKSFGLAYTLAGQETQFIELGTNAPANEKRPFKYLLALEKLGTQPDQLVSYFVWAEDIGPDGAIRRTSGDMYFAEIRPFEEIFRKGESPDGGEGGQPPQGDQPQGNKAVKLAELQKQIINATWKLQRDKMVRPSPLKKP